MTLGLSGILDGNSGENELTIIPDSTTATAVKILFCTGFVAIEGTGFQIERGLLVVLDGTA